MDRTATTAVRYHEATVLKFQFCSDNGIPEDMYNLQYVPYCTVRNIVYVSL